MSGYQPAPVYEAHNVETRFQEEETMPGLDMFSPEFSFPLGPVQNPRQQTRTPPKKEDQAVWNPRQQTRTPPKKEDQAVWNPRQQTRTPPKKEDQAVWNPRQQTRTPPKIVHAVQKARQQTRTPPKIVHAVQKASSEHVHVETQLQNPRMKSLLQLIKNKKPRITQLLKELLLIAAELLVKCVSRELVKMLDTLLNKLMHEFHPIKTAIETAVAESNNLNLAEKEQLKCIIKSYNAIPFENPVSIETVGKEGLQYHANMMKLNDATMEFLSNDYEKGKCSKCGS